MRPPLPTLVPTPRQSTAPSSSVPAFFGVAVESAGRPSQTQGHPATGRFVGSDQMARPVGNAPLVFEASHRLDKSGGILDLAVPIVWQPNDNPSHYEVAGLYGDLKITPAGDWIYELRNDDPFVDSLNDGDVVGEVFFIRLRDAAGGFHWPAWQELEILIYGTSDASPIAADAVAQQTNNAPIDAAPGAVPSSHPNANPNAAPSIAAQPVFDIVGPGDYAAHDRPVIIVGSHHADAPTVTSPAGSIVHLKRGGHQISAETITLNDGVDHVIYLLAPGLVFGTWRPDGGYQIIRNFDLGVDKLWFLAAPGQGGPPASIAFKNHRFEGTIIFETFDSDADQDPRTTDHDALRAVSISAAPHALLRLVLHKLTVEFDQLDDQRAAFQIISNQPATGVTPFDAVAELFGDSLGYIDDWHDIPISGTLPDAASLPSIV